jgi:hypothetical protein
MLGIAGLPYHDNISLRDVLLAILTMINWERGEIGKV